jgi:hypothetical protein
MNVGEKIYVVEQQDTDSWTDGYNGSYTSFSHHATKEGAERARVKREREALALVFDVRYDGHFDPDKILGEIRRYHPEVANEILEYLAAPTTAITSEEDFWHIVKTVASFRNREYPDVRIRPQILED